MVCRGCFWGILGVSIGYGGDGGRIGDIRKWLECGCWLGGVDNVGIIWWCVRFCLI